MTITWRLSLPDELATTMPTPVASGVYWQADANTFLLELPQLARFQVHAGIVNMLVWAILRKPRSVNGYRASRCRGLGTAGLSGDARRGFAHIRRSGLLAGPSATGKSVLAAALAQRGCPFSRRGDTAFPLVNWTIDNACHA